MRRWSVVLAIVLFGTSYAHADRWDKKKGNCDQTFRSWRTQSVAQLSECVMLWEMYRDVTRVDRDQKAVMHEAIGRLYREGDKRDSVMALSALKRLGLRPRTTLRTDTRAVPKEMEAPAAVPVVDTREPQYDRPVRTVEVDAAPDPKAARQAYDEGRRFYQAGQYAEALSEFLIAADTDPTFAHPLYFAARCHVRLRQPRGAIQALKRMKAMNSEHARQLLRRAPKDAQFGRLRRESAFKDLTGTATIQILNGAGEGGVATVRDYKTRLEASGLQVAQVANDRNPRRNTYVYTKPGYEPQGESIRRQLQLGMVHSRTIDWPSEYDIILIHGMAGTSKWVDDEAEKGNKAAAEKKKKEAAAKKKRQDAALKQKGDMKKQIQMMKMMEQMNAAEAQEEAGLGVPDDPIDAIPPPP